MPGNIRATTRVAPTVVLLSAFKMVGRVVSGRSIRATTRVAPTRAVADVWTTSRGDPRGRPNRPVGAPSWLAKRPVGAIRESPLPELPRRGLCGTWERCARHAGVATMPCPAARGLPAASRGWWRRTYAGSRRRGRKTPARWQCGPLPEGDRQPKYHARRL